MSGLSHSLKRRGARYTHSRRVLADVKFEETAIEFRDGDRPHPIGMFWILEDQNIVSWTRTSSLGLASRNPGIYETLTLRSANSMVIQLGVDVAGSFSSGIV